MLSNENQSDAAVVCLYISIYNVYSKGLNSTDAVSDITACVVNIIMAILTCVGNCAVILAYHRNQALQTKSNLLIVSLAFTDLLVGVLVQPMFVTVKMIEMMGNIDCSLEVVSDLLTKFSFSVSLLTLGVVVTTERYLAVFLPIKHHTWLTKKKLVYSIAFLWLGTAIVILFIPMGLPRLVYQYFGLTLIVLTLTTSLILYIKIAKKVRSFKSRVADTHGSTRERPRHVSWASNPSQIRAAVTMFYVLGSLFLCWIPMFSGLLYVFTKGQNLVYQKFLWTWGVTCIFLNSFCNPFIYSCRNRNMSLAIRRLFLKDRNVDVAISSSLAGQSHISKMV